MGTIDRNRNKSVQVLKRGFAILKMKTTNTKLQRGKKTISAMIKMNCKNKHQVKEDLCAECKELLDYVHYRMDKCKFGENKPACSKCPVHCFGKEMRRKIISVMRHAGPRMLIRHPIFAFQHIIDFIRKVR